MRRLAMLVMLVMLAAIPAAAQQVNSTQVKAKTDGGLVGDSAGAIAVAPPRLASPPSSPVTGQLYCDTGATPCVLKQWNGASWEALSAQSPQYAASAVTFPSTPTTGQLFYTQSPPTLWVYDAAVSGWRAMNTSRSYTSGSLNISSCTSSVLDPPPSALIPGTPATTGGSVAVGNYSYKVTFVISSGGETTPSPASNNVYSSSSTSSVPLTSIPTGPAGTVARSIYRSKVNQQVNGPWYFDQMITDNTTTTATDVKNDNTLTTQPAPYNLSGALPAGWEVVGTVTPGTGTPGGFGCTADGGFAGWQGGIVAWNQTLNPTSDPLALLYPISSYTSGDFTLKFRVTKFTAYAGGGQTGACFTGVRKDTSTNSIESGIELGFNAQPPLVPYNTCLAPTWATRSSAGGQLVGSGANIISGTPVCSTPFWVRIDGRVSSPTSGYRYGVSQDDLDWMYLPGNLYSGPNYAASLGYYYTMSYASLPATYLVFFPNVTTTNAVNGQYLEFDTVALWVQ